jgi:DNA repair photolyase
VLNAAGVPCGVLMAPILPGLTDSPDRLAATVAAIAEAGARHVTPIVLHLRPGAREWFMQWLAATYPELVTRYERMYARSAYAPKAYQDDVCGRVREFAQAAGIGRRVATDRVTTSLHRQPTSAALAAPPDQLSLLPTQ